MTSSASLFDMVVAYRSLPKNSVDEGVIMSHPMPGCPSLSPRRKKTSDGSRRVNKDLSGGSVKLSGTIGDDGGEVANNGSSAVSRSPLGGVSCCTPHATCWLKLWLFVAYVVSFVSLAGSVGLLIQDALTDKGPSAWTGVAGVLQCVFVLISGLIYWACHSED